MTRPVPAPPPNLGIPESHTTNPPPLVRMNRAERREASREMDLVLRLEPSVVLVEGPIHPIRRVRGSAVVYVEDYWTPRQVKEAARPRLERLYGHRLSLAALQLTRQIDLETARALAGVARFLSSGRE